MTDSPTTTDINIVSFKYEYLLPCSDTVFSMLVVADFRLETAFLLLFVSVNHGFQ